MARQDKTGQIFPNPAKDILFVDFSKVDYNRYIQLFNSYGQLIFNQKAFDSKKTIPLKSLNPSGLIIVKIISNPEISEYKVSVLD